MTDEDGLSLCAERLSRAATKLHRVIDWRKAEGFTDQETNEIEKAYRLAMAVMYRLVCLGARDPRESENRLQKPYIDIRLDDRIVKRFWKE